MSKVEDDKVRVRMGKKIRTARILHDLTQAQLAQAVGVAPQQIGNYENGAYNIPPSTLRLLCKVLGLSLDEIYANGNEEVREISSPTATFLLRPLVRQLVQVAGPMDDEPLRALINVGHELAHHQIKADDGSSSGGGEASK